MRPLSFPLHTCARASYWIGVTLAALLFVVPFGTRASAQPSGEYGDARPAAVDTVTADSISRHSAVRPADVSAGNNKRATLPGTSGPLPAPAAIGTLVSRQSPNLGQAANVGTEGPRPSERNAWSEEAPGDRHAAASGTSLVAPLTHVPPVVTNDAAPALYVFQVRAAVDAAWNATEGAPRKQRAASAFALARRLDARTDSTDARDLLVRAQALYEHYNGGVAGSALSPAEWAALRGDALANASAMSEGLATRHEEAKPIDPSDRLTMTRDRAPHDSTTGRSGTSDTPFSTSGNGLDSSTAQSEPAGGGSRTARSTNFLVPDHAEPLVLEQLGIARRHLAGLGRRTRRYFPMIERTLARRGLPDELKYVAVIESALNPTAESHAGAAGLWQFMPATGAEFGLDSLTVLDPTRATDAAARLLKRLHRQFHGDWQLALAAYNSGSGRVSRLVRAFQTETGRYPSFWDIHADLPRETQDYVPRFIAVTRMYEPQAAP